MQKIMKKFAVLLLAAGMSILHAEPPLPPVQLAPRIPRKIEIGAEPLFEMVKDGQVNFEIVVPAEAPRSVQFAGTEAASLLGRMFGSKLKVLHAPSGKSPAIIIGDFEFAAKLGVDVNTLDRDGFVIRTFPGGVLIIGRDGSTQSLTWGEHASLFGTYDFLEKFTGMRFYLPGNYGTVVPKRREWSLPAIDLYDRPDLYQRRYVDYNAELGGELNQAALDINRLRNRCETNRIYYPHTLRYLTYGKRFGDSHPEYFSLQSNGKRVIDKGFKSHGDSSHFCYTSDFKNEVIADILSCMKGEEASVRGIINPETGKSGWHWSFRKGRKLFTLDLPDCVKKCTCPKCATEVIRGTKEQQIEHYLRFFCEVAQGVKDAGIGGCLVIPCHYGWWEGMPPSFSIPDNIILLASARGPWNELTPFARDKDLAELKAWANKGNGKLLLWTYPGKYSFSGLFPGIPSCTPRYAASFLKRVKPYISGCYFENATDRLFFSYLDWYIYGKILWDPDADVEKLLQEHAELMFGPAAAPMKEFFDSLERNWMKIAGNTENTNQGPLTRYPPERVIWGDIYSEAERKRIDGLFEEALKLTGDAPEYRDRVKTLHREMWQPLLQAAEKYTLERKAVAALGARMPETREAPVIDGKLDEPAWQNAELITLLPKREEAPEQLPVTTVRALRDSEYFYFGFQCEEKTPPQAPVRLFDSKSIWRDSCVEIFLSPDKSYDRCFQIMISAAGSIADLARSRGKIDWSWNSGAEAKCLVTPGTGWTAEIRIPRSSMPQADGSGMLANLTRRHVKANSDSVNYTWGPFFQNSNAEIEHFGTLRFQPQSAPATAPADK